MFRFSFSFQAVFGLMVILPATAKDEIPIRPLLEQYCFKCHDAEVRKGDFRIDAYSSPKQVIRHRKQWLKVLEQLETREMPTKKPLPTEEEYGKMIAWVDKAVNDIDWDRIKHPGHVTIPRLTKTEYNRTMADLLGVDIRPGRDFSEDGEGASGFNNDRDALLITASQMEKYFSAAERAIDAVMAFNAEPVELHFESENMFMTESGSKVQAFDDESKGYVLNRGQMTLYDAIEVPHDGSYRFTVRARSTGGPTGGVLRINDVVSGDFEVSGREPADLEMVVFLEKGSHQMAWNIKGFDQARPQPRLKKPAAYPQPPENANQIITVESTRRHPKFPRNGKESEAVIALLNQFDGRQNNVQRAYEWLRLYGSKGDPRQLERFHGYVQERMKPVEEVRPKLIEALGISEEQFEKRFTEANRESLADRLRLIEMAESRIIIRPGSLAIDWIRIDGPVLEGDSAKANHLASLFRDDGPASTEPGLITELTGFARNAFRRPVTEAESDRLAAIYRESKDQTKSHAEALKQALVAVLVSPKFLYRVEQGPAESGESEFALDDWEIASRLSYALWMSMPDDTLFALAEKGKLRDPDILAVQIDRMLNHEKAGAFLSGFAGQWLGYETLGISLNPDARRFPQFTAALAAAMKAEANLWFAEVFRGDRSILDLIDAKESFLNAALARHYAIPGVKGAGMQRVSLSDEKRGGILGMGAVLTATSTPVRTSPVIRGVWVMERILGEDPGEPLADAGELPGNAGEQRGKTLREELEIHRDKPECASCHDAIDPLGFGLEQFDAIGRFREKEAGKPIDASGVMPDGTGFSGVVELKRYLLENRKDDILRNVTERLLAFVLGRELQYYDEPAIGKIVAATKAEGYRSRTLVKQVMTSYPFLNQHPSPELSD